MSKTKRPYKYWKWVLLSKHTAIMEEKEKRGITAIYNQIDNTICRYDFNNKKYKETRWAGLDWIFENSLAEFLTIGELEEFYKSLPKSKKELFWDCIYNSENRNNLKQKGEIKNGNTKRNKN